MEQALGFDDYLYTFTSNALKIQDMSEAEKKHRFLEGLPIPMRREIAKEDPASFEEAVRLAQHLTAYDSLLPSFRKTPINPSASTPMELGGMTKPRGPLSAE